MSPRKQYRGICTYCGTEIAKNGVARHLAACASWNELVAKAEQQECPSEPLHHLRVQATDMPEYWLDLEMRGWKTLADLDHYLRAIWLECCGHMSQFSFGGWMGGKISMKQHIQKVFQQPGTELTHIYDFGTSSETLIKAVRVREGKPVTSHPIVLLVRNVMPEAQCIECNEPASWWCMECLIEDEVCGTLCDKHKKSHPHHECSEPIRLVNSPRLGLCGYDGPATPPY